MITQTEGGLGAPGFSERHTQKKMHVGVLERAIERLMEA